MVLMVDAAPPEDPFDRFLRWLHALLHALRVRIDAIVARIVLTITPGTGV